MNNTSNLKYLELRYNDTTTKTAVLAFSWLVLTSCGSIDNFCEMIILKFIMIGLVLRKVEIILKALTRLDLKFPCDESYCEFIFWTPSSYPSLFNLYCIEIAQKSSDVDNIS